MLAALRKHIVSNNHKSVESKSNLRSSSFLPLPNLLDDASDDYIADLMTSRQNEAQPEALRQIEADSEPTALIDCIRYVLLRTSLNSAAENFVPELVSRAVETGVWSV